MCMLKFNHLKQSTIKNMVSIEQMQFTLHLTNKKIPLK